MLEVQELPGREYKFLRISSETHRELTEIGKKNESYDDLIARLIKFYKEHQEGRP